MVENYNTTELFNSTNLLDVYSAVNTMTNDLLTIIVLLIIFIIAYFNINATSANRRFMGASLICSIVGGLFWFGGMLTDYIVGIAPLIFLITVVIDFFD
jgi:hypothetical protein